ncbi:MAG: SH3 domain-containing protein, partial [Deltaproteobacteria bacterium]|nr:SH3 domain-containing protein [Deltaproteobacteria bacterium]
MLGLLAVWLIGRVMEALHGKTIFDMTLTYWLGLIIYILMAIWAVGFALSTSDDLRTARQRKLAILSWLFFISLTAVLLLSFEGYRISSKGLLATISGSQESSDMAIFLLYKYHFMNPLLSLNLVASKFMGLAWDVQSFAPFVWSWNFLLGFFIWSGAYGILLLLQKGRKGVKSTYLVFSAFGLLGLIILKSASTPTIEQMSMIQAAVTILIVAQVLLAYSSFRQVAAGPSDPGQKSADTFNDRRPDNDQVLENRFVGLPPSAIKLVLVLFFVVPLIADMHNQFLTALSTKRILDQVTIDEDSSKTGFSAITAISIRTGPTRGDDVIGILPKGAHIQVLDERNGWVEIGQN